ncbi:hypothetical protein [Desulfobulbus sp.]|uniref:hypothetical protein n=1 Tax=Desulfobulbus sp. TaxID=895 RepID=UPI00286F4E16|nr:hypothetical protein [Desulfobulbus sp.]
MTIRIEQSCPQCGAGVEFVETDHILTCSYCGIRSLLQCGGPFRYVLPMAGKASSTGLLLAPYLRFKGTIYLVSSETIEHRVVDTTQAANPSPGLPPSLGLRPQAMPLIRVIPEAGNLFLPQTLKAGAIVEKAAAVGNFAPPAGGIFYHRAYIGEHLSYIYLPLVIKKQGIYDGVNGNRLIGLADTADGSLDGRPFADGWRIRFEATLCPQCGAGLEGTGDCRVMTCATCASAWEVGSTGLSRMEWQMQPTKEGAALFLPFWQVSAQIPALRIASFADFVVRSNQPFLPRPQWGDKAMSVWVPAIRLRPKVFLQAGRQATLGQWRLAPVPAKVRPNQFPVTLPSSEARQAVKLILAAATASPRRIFPLLPQVRLAEVAIRLVYLPFIDRGHDWVQPETGVAVDKNILGFSRSL